MIVGAVERSLGARRGQELTIHSIREVGDDDAIHRFLTGSRLRGDNRQRTWSVLKDQLPALDGRSSYLCVRHHLERGPAALDAAVELGATIPRARLCPNRSHRRACHAPYRSAWCSTWRSMPEAATSPRRREMVGALMALGIHSAFVVPMRGRKEAAYGSVVFLSKAPASRLRQLIAGRHAYFVAVCWSAHVRLTMLHDLEGEPPITLMTRREREVYRLLAAGFSPDAIAERLGNRPAHCRSAFQDRARAPRRRHARGGAGPGAAQRSYPALAAGAEAGISRVKGSACQPSAPAGRPRG